MTFSFPSGQFGKNYFPLLPVGVIFLWTFNRNLLSRNDWANRTSPTNRPTLSPKKGITLLKTNNEHQDKELIDRYLQGDSEAHGIIQTMITRVVENDNWSLQDQWEDIEQDIHQRLFVNFQSGKFEFRSLLKHYVYKVSKYTCLAYVREKYTRREFFVDPEELSFPSTGSEVSVELEIQKTALQFLSRECLKIFRLYFFEGYSYHEIGEQLNMQKGTIKSRMFRCKQKARQIKRKLLKKRELSPFDKTP